MSQSSKKIAQALLQIKAVGFTEKPIRFKSGILSPVYVDNRTLPFHPKEWQYCIDGFSDLVINNKVICDGIAGIESAGIPHSAVLGFTLQKPSVFVRKAAKDHGTKRMIEGGDVTGRRILLIEDLVTTGGSSLHGVTQLRAAGATVTDCACIVSYGFSSAQSAFQAANVRLHPLITFDELLDEALRSDAISQYQFEQVREWLRDPMAWTKAHEAV